MSFGCEVKIESMHEEEDSNIHEASFTICWRPFRNVIFSTLIFSYLFLSCFNQVLDLTLMAPRITNKNGLFWTQSSSSSYELSEGI